MSFEMKDLFLAPTLYSMFNLDSFVTPDGSGTLFNGNSSSNNKSADNLLGFLSGNDKPIDSLANSDYEFMEYLQGLMTTVGEENAANRLYNAEQAQKNRDWQEYMSNTSYQRAVADLQKAGLNPILAYSQGGASTPSSSAASYNVGGGDTLSTLLNNFVHLISSATSLGSILGSLLGKK